MYHVWRRDDGYVAASCYEPKDYTCGGWDPPSNQPRIYGPKVTFQQIGKYEKWEEAYMRILLEYAYEENQLISASRNFLTSLRFETEIEPRTA